MKKKCKACGMKLFKPICFRCGMEDLESDTHIPEQVKEEHVKNFQFVSESLSVDEVEKMMKNAAMECDFELGVLVVKNDFEGVLEVIQETDDFHDLTLRYNPLRLRAFTNEEVQALLRHEIMHPVTMKEASKVIVNGSTSQEGQAYQAEIQYAYDEFINYKEYSKKRPNDPDLHKARKKLFSSFTIRFLRTKFKINNNSLDHYYEPVLEALIIYEDAVFNLFEKKEKLIKWTEYNKAEALHRLWTWISEDFDIINENITQRDEIRKILGLTSGMILSIDIEKIFTENKIEFNEEYENILNYCKTNFQGDTSKQIIAKWEDRF